MRQTPPELAALQHALGRQLAAARRAAGVCQQQVAHKAGYSRSSVAHAEAGRQLLTRAFWKAADELVEADGALLDGYERVHAAIQDHERRSLAAARAAAEEYAAAQAARSTDPSTDLLQVESAEWRDQLYERLARFLDGWADTVKRRDLLQLLGWAATAVAASPVLRGLDTDEQARLAQAVASPSRVDAQVVEDIEAMLRNCKRQDDALGPQAVLRTVLAQRQLVSDLLAGCPAPLRPRLLSVYSSMSSSVGFYCFNLDDVVSALYYCDQARAAAQEARDTRLAVYALCNASYFASWHGRAHAGIDYAAAAQSLAAGTDDALLRVCVAQRAAMAYAVDGQDNECMKALERAQAGFESAPAAPTPESPVYWFNEALMASKESECLLRLGKPRQAAARASDGIRLFEDSFTGDLAFCLLRLGTAHLRSGEVDEAARVVGDAALLATRAPSSRLLTDVRATRAHMRPWQGVPALDALDERLAAYGLKAGAGA